MWNKSDICVKYMYKDIYKYYLWKKVHTKYLRLHSIVESYSDWENKNFLIYTHCSEKETVIWRVLFSVTDTQKQQCKTKLAIYIPF